MSTSKKRQAFIQGLRKVQAEGQGVWNCRVVMLEQLPQLFSLVCRGGDDTLRRLHDLTLSGFLQIFEARETSRPALCLLCDYTFTTINRPPVALVVVTGHIDAPEAGIINPLCSRCFDAGGDELMRRIVTAYGDHLMDGKIRVLDPINEPPGHA